MSDNIVIVFIINGTYQKIFSLASKSVCDQMMFAYALQQTYCDMGPRVCELEAAACSDSNYINILHTKPCLAYDHSDTKFAVESWQMTALGIHSTKRRRSMKFIK